MSHFKSMWLTLRYPGQSVQGGSFRAKACYLGCLADPSCCCSQLEHQMELLMVGAEPTARPTSINLLIDRVKDHGDTRLAEKANAALNVYRAVKRGPPTFRSAAQRTIGPKLLNVASLVRRQHEADVANTATGSQECAAQSATTVWTEWFGVTHLDSQRNITKKPDIRSSNEYPTMPNPSPRNEKMICHVHSALQDLCALELLDLALVANSIHGICTAHELTYVLHGSFKAPSALTNYCLGIFLCVMLRNAGDKLIDEC
eukprot:scaffold11989_cov31-Prasinocladus_malaysianus.AAC.1